MANDGRGRPPVLLTQPGFCGTLAAARTLGEHGIPVAMADAARFAAGSWSRHVTRRLRCPPIAATDEFLDWLLDFGAREPGYVLYPTSDDLAWLCAVHADALEPFYRLYSPSASAIQTVLDKGCLHALCGRVGIETPRAWFPCSERALGAVAAEARFPLVIKLRSQVLSTTHTKGVVVNDPTRLPECYAEFVRVNSHGAAIASRYPAACRPMVQEYHPEVTEGTLLVAGFVRKDGELLAARAAHKVLQIPRRLGITLCLEEAPLNPSVLERIAELCRTAGYHGVFHLEFIRTEGRLLLIDFNPRFYHHLAFEAARGMPLPLFAYHAACGDLESLARATSEARRSEAPAGRAFVHRFDFEVMLAGQRATRRMSGAEANRWRLWRAMHDGALVDAVGHPRDPVPQLLDAATHIHGWARHPRAFLRKMLLNAD